MNMRGIACEKAAARGKSADMTRVDFVGGKPLDVLNIQIEFGFRLNSRFNLFLQNFLHFFIEFFRKYADDAITPSAFERKEDHE